MVASPISLEGCAPRVENDIQKAKSYLEEKYSGYSFEVGMYQGSGLPGTSSTTNMICSATDGSAFVFETVISVSSGKLQDNYPSAYIAKTVSDSVIEEFSAQGIRAYASLSLSMMNAEVANERLITDVNEYLDITKTESVFGVVLIDKATLDAVRFGTALESVFTELHSRYGIDAGVGVYVAPSNILSAAEEELAKILALDAGTWVRATEHEQQYDCAFSYQVRGGTPSSSMDEINDYLQKGYQDERVL
jgi:hypothetical protein